MEGLCVGLVVGDVVGAVDGAVVGDSEECRAYHGQKIDDERVEEI